MEVRRPVPPWALSHLHLYRDQQANAESRNVKVCPDYSSSFLILKV